MTIFKRANIFLMSPREVQQAVLKTGEEASYIASTKTEAIQALTNGLIDTTRGAVTTHSGARVGKAFLKVPKIIQEAM